MLFWPGIWALTSSEIVVPPITESQPVAPVGNDGIVKAALLTLTVPPVTVPLTGIVMSTKHLSAVAKVCQDAGSAGVLRPPP